MNIGSLDMHRFQVLSLPDYVTSWFESRGMLQLQMHNFLYGGIYTPTLHMASRLGAGPEQGRTLKMVVTGNHC